MKLNNNILILNNQTNNNTISYITNNLQVLEFVRQITKTIKLATQINNQKDLDLYFIYNLIKFIFNTKVTIYTITNKSLFITYNTTNKYVSWRKVKTL